ncbi:hypothetical protein BX600DRAFT_100267 [Xylariales sp. PMI_506]|nr:hypothetical protein BX600DRAFT_100267 [Xylariales sp. PMI_506]
MEPSTLDLWKVRVPELACSYEYLMHGLLAISALHYSQAHPEDRREYSIISTQYQNLAINYFATRLGDINETNCEPYFLLATMIFVLTNCSINNTHGRDSPVTAAEVAQTFMMLQGIKTILDFKPLQRWNQGGPLAPLLDEPSELQIPDRDTAFTARLDGLIALTRELNPSFDVISARSSCVLALESLRSTYCACTDPQARRRGRYMWLWPMTLPQKFIELISASSPIALIILAHYAALVNSYEHRTWVTRGLGASFMSMVERALEPPWHKHIVWPKRCVLEERHVDDKWEENDIMETSP